MRIVKLSLLILFGSTFLLAKNPTVKTGIEVLKQNNFKILDGKKVGLVTNQTGLDDNFKSTVDILHEAKNVELIALFGPEHGVRGDYEAGAKVEFIRMKKPDFPFIHYMVKHENPMKKC